MVSFPGIPQANDPGLSTAASLINQGLVNRTTLQRQKSENVNELIKALLGQVGTGVREKFSDERGLQNALQQAQFKETLPSTQAATQSRKLSALNTGLGLVGDENQASQIGDLTSQALGLSSGLGQPDMGGSMLPPPDFKSELLPGATPPQNDQGAFQLGAEAEQPIASGLVRSNVPINFQKKQLDTGLVQERTKDLQFKNTERQRQEEFIYGGGNQKASDALNKIRQGDIVYAQDRAGQDIEGLELTPELISRRKSFEVARKRNGKLMADGVKAIDATETLLNDYVPAVEAAIRAREKGFDLNKNIQSRTVQTTEGLVRTFVSQSKDPDILALVTYMNSVPALATPVAKTAGEDRLTNEDIARFSNLMGDANLSSDALRQQSQFFLRKLLLQGGNIAATIGDQRFSRFNSVNQELFDKPITIGKFNINSDQIKSIKGGANAPVSSNVGGRSRAALDLSNIDDLI